MGNNIDFGTCASQRTCGGFVDAAVSEPRPKGDHRVELASSILFGVPPLASAYHTSVLVNGEEYFFSDSGVFYDGSMDSHQGQATEKLEMGFSTCTGTQLYLALDPYFKPGSYDLLRKNCNSFSDCALFFLLRVRLPRKYSALERMGQGASGLVTQVTNGLYTPNPYAADFQVEHIIQEIEKSPVPEPRATVPGCPRLALFAGAKVTILGLKSATHLNGKAAEVVRYNAVSGRWEVRVCPSGEEKALHAENLRPAGEGVHLEAGCEVVIDGLTSDEGKRLNGTAAVVLRYIHESSRYEVRIGEMTKALKWENLRPR